MRKKINILILLFFLVTNSCGYTPVFDSTINNFFIKDLQFNGDTKINNLIKRNLNKFTTFVPESKGYELTISSVYEKKIVNKDEKGNPKNYNIIILAEVKIITDIDNEIIKTFKKNSSLAAESNKITEFENEKEYQKTMTKTLSDDIILFLRELN